MTSEPTIEISTDTTPVNETLFEGYDRLHSLNDDQLATLSCAYETWIGMEHELPNCVTYDGVRIVDLVQSAFFDRGHAYLVRTIETDSDYSPPFKAAIKTHQATFQFFQGLSKADIDYSRFAIIYGQTHWLITLNSNGTNPKVVCLQTVPKELFEAARELN